MAADTPRARLPSAGPPPAVHCPRPDLWPVPRPGPLDQVHLSRCEGDRFWVMIPISLGRKLRLGEAKWFA